MRTRVRTLERLCFVIGVSLLLYAGSMALYRLAYQTYLTMTFRPEIPVVAIHDGTARRRSNHMPLGKIEVPRLKLSAMVLDGTDDKTLDLAAGHITGTALPGQEGNVGIAAHRDTFFRQLREIRKGDVIRVTTYAGAFEYRVEWTRIVKPTAVDVLEATSKPSLTLVTCYPFRYVGPAPDRFIVRAVQFIPAAGASLSS